MNVRCSSSGRSHRVLAMFAAHFRMRFRSRSRAISSTRSLRGRARINYAKVKDMIDKAVDGIMKGEFPKKAGCEGVCTLI